MTDKIFGYDWKDIQAMQNKTYWKQLARNSSIRPANKGDYDLLQKYGSLEALKQAGFNGSYEVLNNVITESELK